jgi:hypothetical protein
MWTSGGRRRDCHNVPGWRGSGGTGGSRHTGRLVDRIVRGSVTSNGDSRVMLFEHQRRPGSGGRADAHPAHLVHEGAAPVRIRGARLQSRHSCNTGLHTGATVEGREVIVRGRMLWAAGLSVAVALALSIALPGVFKSTPADADFTPPTNANWVAIDCDLATPGIQDACTRATGVGGVQLRPRERQRRRAKSAVI